jgi:hypothetical protein
LTEHQAILETNLDGGMNLLDLEAFKIEVQRFLSAVKQRDFGTFKTFFREDLAFYAALPDGTIFNDVPSFLKSQEPWFFGTTGTFKYQIQGVSLDRTLGTTTNKIEYTNVDASGSPFTLRDSDHPLSFGTKMEDGS